MLSDKETQIVGSGGVVTIGHNTQDQHKLFDTMVIDVTSGSSHLGNGKQPRHTNLSMKSYSIVTLHQP